MSLLTELLADLLKDKPQETDGFESVIVVDGLPVVGPERFEKLKNFVCKHFIKYGTIVNEFHPKNENGETKG